MSFDLGFLKDEIKQLSGRLKNEILTKFTLPHSAELEARLKINQNSREIDEFVDDSAGHEVEGAFPGLVEVVGDQGVDPDAQVVLHEHLPRGLRQHS
jgi:hypothetical protein